MNLQDPIRKANHDSKGRFVKGSCPNPKGNNQFTSIVPLLQALEQTGVKHNRSFWDMVAEKCFGSRNESLLIAVLKKILPDKLQGEGFGNSGIYVYIVKDGHTGKRDSDRIALPASPEPADHTG